MTLVDSFPSLIYLTLKSLTITLVYFGSFGQTVRIIFCVWPYRFDGICIPSVPVLLCNQESCHTRATRVDWSQTLSAHYPHLVRQLSPLHSSPFLCMCVSVCGGGCYCAVRRLWDNFNLKDASMLSWLVWGLGYSCLGKAAQRGKCFYAGINLFNLVAFIPCYLLSVPEKPLALYLRYKQAHVETQTQTFFFLFPLHKLLLFFKHFLFHMCVWLYCLCVYVCKALPALTVLW